MIITCPNCSTKYNLPDEKVSVNSKLRCTVCKHIFSLPSVEGLEDLEYNPNSEPEMQESNNFSSDFDSFDMPSPHMPKKKSKILPSLLILFILILGGVYGVYRYTPYLDMFKTEVAEELPTEQETQLIYLRGVRQYNISNEKLGKLSVIEGKAVNGFDIAKELIKLEAVLYDNERNVLVAKQQLAGTSVSLFQLQVLSEQELDQALGNKIDILANNTNVAPGAEVPFMIVFFNPPENASEFGVRVTEARTVEKK